MSSEEENLEDLLKSIMEGDEVHEDEPEESNHSEINEESTEDIDSIEETLALDDLDFAIEESEEDESSPMDLDLEFALEEPGDDDEDDSMLSSDFDITMENLEEDADSDNDSALSDDFSLDDFAIQELDIDDIDLENLEFDDAMELEETEEEISLDGLMSSDDVDAIFAEVDAIATTDMGEEKNVDDDIAEISGLLQSDSSDISDDIADDEMLALLASMTSDIDESEESFISDSFDDLAGIAEFMEETEEQEDSVDKKKKKEKKGSFLKRLKGRKKGKEEQQEDSETETEVEIEQDIDFQSEFDTSTEEIDTEEAEDIDVSKPAKQNFISKFLSFLTETDEDDEMEKLKEEHGMEPSDENRNILEELDAEDKKKKKKKVRGKKSGKEEADDMEDDDESSDANQKKARAKKKKEKKAKVQKEIPAISSKPEKKISKKSISLVIGFALTVAVVIIVFCVLIPGILDKRVARDAYYTADYSKAYELLYGKELDNSDTLIFNKSKTILEMNRKLASYHNYMSMDKEVQALDALMSGIEKYPELLANAEEYHVTQEVNVIYTTILNILNDRYYITEALAKIIVAYEDDLMYTRKLESIVYGTPFLEPVEVSESVAVVSDVLPEEEDIIDESMLNLPQENNAPEEDVSSAVNNDQIEDASQEQTEDTVIPEPDTQDIQEPSESADESQQVPVESNTNTGGQGQLIHGIRQPISIEIHGN